MKWSTGFSEPRIIGGVQVSGLNSVFRSSLFRKAQHDLELHEQTCHKYAKLFGAPPKN